MQPSDIKEKYTPRLLEYYRDKIVPGMKSKFGYANSMAVPRLNKIVVNMGVRDATTDSKSVERCAAELALIAGQKPKITRAKKPISNFKIKKGMPIGCCVTLRRFRMYEFLDRLITAAVPRIRDFRGFSQNSFDGHGNYTFGITEQIIFPEVDIDKTEKMQGMDITINTSAETDEEAKELLNFLGFPFRR